MGISQPALGALACSLDSRSQENGELAGARYDLQSNDNPTILWHAISDYTSVPGSWRFPRKTFNNLFRPDSGIIKKDESISHDLPLACAQNANKAVVNAPHRDTAHRAP